MYPVEVITGRELPLTELANEDETPFAGITADGTSIFTPTGISVPPRRDT
jgi:hypothetical protein